MIWTILLCGTELQEGPSYSSQGEVVVNKIAFFTAVTATLVGAAAGHLYLAHVEDEAAGGAPMSVLIATHDLAPGDLLTEADLGQRSIPQAFVGARHIRAEAVKRVVGVRLNTRIDANEPILWSDVAALGRSGRDLSSTVQEGKRAFPLRSAGTFDGLLRPGDRVDVLFTDGETTSTRTLLQDILVLAVGGQMDAKVSTRAAGQVVVSVDPQQSQRLATAEQYGRLLLVVRNAADIKVLDELPEATQRDVMGTPPEEPRTVSRGSEKADKREIERVH